MGKGVNELPKICRFYVGEGERGGGGNGRGGGRGRGGGEGEGATRPQCSSGKWIERVRIFRVGAKGRGIKTMGWGVTRRAGGRLSLVFLLPSGFP